jgi:hypothetical protein
MNRREFVKRSDSVSVVENFYFWSAWLLFRQFGFFSGANMLKLFLTRIHGNHLFSDP